jgi:pilus assembly protein CpaC
MPRTIGRTRSLCWGTMLALSMCGLASFCQAQPAALPTILVPLGGTKDVQMTTKKAIAKVEAKRDGVISVRPVPGDPSTVRLIGQSAESTVLDLTDENGKVESFLVIVQRDVENLKAQLRRAVPTANILVTPINETTVLLTGTMASSPDAVTVEQIVRSLGFISINRLNVAGVQQVELDVVVAVVSRSAIRRMAFDWLTNSKNFYFASTGSGAVTNPLTAGSGQSGPTGLTSALGGLAGTVGSPNGAGTNLLFGVLHNSWNFLGFLQALRDDNLLKIVAEPKLVTMSGTPASFIDGGEQAVPVPAGLGQIGVQFEEFGTRLNFLPIVLGNGRIHLEVEPEFSTLDPANGVSIEGTVVPGRDTHRAHATVEMEPDHTLVIGGLIQKQVTASTVKVPVLGELPYFGVFFSSKEYEETDEEVLILVTPKLVEAFDCAHAPKYLPGEETRSPDDYELFLEGILEAPRGQRCVFENDRYVAAWKRGPSANMFPCGADNCPKVNVWNALGVNGCGCGSGGASCGSGCSSCGSGGSAYGSGGCANGSCGAAPSPMTPVPGAPPGQPMPQTIPQTLPPTQAAPQPISQTQALPPITPMPADSTLPPADPFRAVPPPEPTAKPGQLPGVLPAPRGGAQP